MHLEIFNKNLAHLKEIDPALADAVQSIHPGDRYVVS
jgi:hypothetical protein